MRIVLRHGMHVGIARFHGLTRIVVFATRFQRQAFLRLGHQLFAGTKNDRTGRTNLYTAGQAALIETLNAFLVTQLTFVKRTKRVVVVVLRYVVWTGNHAVTAASTDVFVVMNDAGFRIFFQCGNRADGNAVGIDAVHTLFFDVRVAILFLIFIHACTATPHLNDVIGIRRQFVVIRPGLLPFRVTHREVDILTLGHTGLTAHAQRRVIQHAQRTGDGRAIFCSRVADRRRSA